MIPAHFLLMAVAEVRKVFSRGSGWFTLIMAFVVALLTSLVMWRLSGAEGVSFNRTTAAEAAANWSAVDTAGWALFLRNLFILPVCLVLATAGSVAGEIGDRTLRELLVRPVSRVSILLAKLISLGVLSAASLLLTLLVSFSAGLLLLGVPADSDKIISLLLGYLASLATDLEWITLAMLLAVILQSTGGVVVGLVVGLGLDLLLMGFLWIMSKVGLEQAADLIKFTLWNGLFAWTGWESGWSGLSWASVVIVSSVALVLALERFRRMDVL